MIRRCAWFVGGLLLHAALLLLPALLLGRAAALLQNSAAVAFVALATLFCGCELVTLWIARDEADCDAPADRTARRLASATGLALLAIFWTALLTSPAAAVTNVLPSALFPSTLLPSAAVCGGALMIAGSLLRLAAIVALGGGFRTEVVPLQASRLVCRGIYRIVRHPSETGLLSVALGAGLLLCSLPALLIWLLLLAPLVLYRLRLEERQLAAAFGAEYEAYRRRVSRLLPLVY